MGHQLLTEKTGRQIPASIEAINPAFEIVEGLRVARVNPVDTGKAIEALRARGPPLFLTNAIGCAPAPGTGVGVGVGVGVM